MMSSKKLLLFLSAPLLSLSVPVNTDVALLYAREKAARKKVVAIRGRGFNAAVDMVRDEVAARAVDKLQDVTRKLLLSKYSKFTVYGGKDGAKGSVFRIKCDVTFPDNMPDIVANGNAGSFVIETAPIELMPHAVLNFVELVTSEPEKDKIAPHFQVNLGHILQIGVDDKEHQGLAFQEYSPHYPHEPLSLGFPGRPAKPSPYISILDNSVNHGPGSQGSTMGEADSCFGRILENNDTLERLKRIWGKPEHGFFPGPLPEQELAKVIFTLCRKGVCE
jgi:hypothetical protein